MKREKMNPKDAWKIDKNRKTFEDDESFEPNDILGKLMEDGIIDEDDEDSIRYMQPPTRCDRVSVFLKIMKFSGWNVLPKIIAILRQFNHGNLAKALEDTVVPDDYEQQRQKELGIYVEKKEETETSESGNTETVVYQRTDSSNQASSSEDEDISQAVRDKHVESKVLSRISNAVGLGWEHVALCLKLSQVQIDHAKQDNKKASMQFYSCLNIWNQSNADATYGHLYNVLLENRNVVTMEMDKIKTALADAANE